MASLERTIPLAEVDALSVGIEEDLDLDVACTLDEALQDEALVAERACRLAPGAGEVREQAVRVTNGPHPLAPTPGGRLDEQRVADPIGGRDQGVVGLIPVVVAGRCRDAESPGQPA